MLRGRCASSRCATFPSSGISSSISAISWRSWCGSSPGSSERWRSRSPSGEYLQSPEELDEYKQFSMCINCMLCYAACPVYGLDPKFIGPAAIALAQRYNLDSRDEGASERLEVLSEHEGIWGCTFVGECTQGVPEERRSGRRDSAVQADRGAGVGEGVLSAEGGVMAHIAGQYTAYHPRWLQAAYLHVLVVATAVVLCVHPARDQQRVRRMVRGVSAADHCMRSVGGPRRIRISSSGAGSRG